MTKAKRGRPGIVVGLTVEARVAERLGYPVRVGGGTPEGATEAANWLVAQGVTGLVSFGFAGGLDPSLRPGSVVIPASILSEGKVYEAEPRLADLFGGLTGHSLVAESEIVVRAASKRRLHEVTRAHAVDLESGSVARVAQAHGLPFIAVRAISDTAHRDLPPAARLALDPGGRVDLMGVAKSLLRHPKQLPALARLAVDAGLARRALVRLIRHGLTAGVRQPA